MDFSNSYLTERVSYMLKVPGGVIESMLIDDGYLDQHGYTVVQTHMIDSLVYYLQWAFNDATKMTFSFCIEYDHYNDQQKLLSYYAQVVNVLNRSPRLTGLAFELKSLIYGNRFGENESRVNDISLLFADLTYVMASRVTSFTATGHAAKLLLNNYNRKLQHLKRLVLEVDCESLDMLL